MKYLISQISNRYACDLSVQFGYSGRRPNAVISYGLVSRENGIVVSSVIYGNAVSPSVCNICGDDEFYNVYELNALWYRRQLDYRYGAVLLKKTLPKLDKEIIVAYCEESQQDMIMMLNCNNFIYLGTTESRTDRGYVGEYKNTLFGKQVIKKNKHNMSAWYDKENTIQVIRKPKLRYVYFSTHNKRRYNELYDKLNYTEKPRPYVNLE